MILRDLATAWVRANCPLPDMQVDFLQALEMAIQRNTTCTFVIGPGLTKSGKPFLVSGFRGEFFAFELTPRQARRLEITDSMLVSAEGRLPQSNEAVAEPIISLIQVDLDYVGELDRSARITGTVSYKTHQPVLHPLALHVVCEPPGRAGIVLYHYLSSLPGLEGTLKFSTPPLGEMPDDNGTPFTGVVPLFFQIWTLSDLPRALHPKVPLPGTVSEISSQSPGLHNPPKNRPLEAASGRAMPTSSPYPPPYDLGPTTAPASCSRPISDIRALLVAIR